MKKITSNKKIFITIFIIIIFICFCIVVNNNYNNNKQSEDVPTDEVDLPQDVLDLEDIKDLKAKYNNDEVVGLLYIPGTNIKEPIVQADNNEYYLNHDLYKNDNIEGAVFLDFRNEINESMKNLIYSHNSQHYDVPFKELEGYYDKEFYNNHRYLYLKSSNSIAKYQIFSVYVETSDWEYTRINFDNKKDWFTHLQDLKDKSLYETGVNISNKNKILILQTCSYHNDYKDFDTKYLLIVSKRVY